MDHSYFVVGDHQFHQGYALGLMKEHVREPFELSPHVQREHFREVIALRRRLGGTSASHYPACDDQRDCQFDDTGNQRAERDDALSDDPGGRLEMRGDRRVRATRVPREKPCHQVGDALGHLKQ